MVGLRVGPCEGRMVGIFVGTLEGIREGRRDGDVAPRLSKYNSATWLAVLSD